MEDSHTLRLIVNTTGFAIEEVRTYGTHTQRRYLYPKLDSYNSAVGAFRTLRGMSHATFKKWLIAHDFEPWFDVQVPETKLPYPVILESHTIQDED